MYSRTEVYGFGYTTSWISRIASVAVRIRRSKKSGTFCKDVRPAKRVTVRKIATLRDDRHARTLVNVFGYATS